jgi:hypothetical protein
MCIWQKVDTRTNNTSTLVSRAGTALSNFGGHIVPRHLKSIMTKPRKLSLISGRRKLSGTRHETMKNPGSVTWCEMAGWILSGQFARKPNVKKLFFFKGSRLTLRWTCHSSIQRDQNMQKNRTLVYIRHSLPRESTALSLNVNNLRNGSRKNTPRIKCIDTVVTFLYKHVNTPKSYPRVLVRFIKLIPSRPLPANLPRKKNDLFKLYHQGSETFANAKKGNFGRVYAI